ncbi:AbrB family transcriptional regulator [Candidatus Pacearchaeota archaeon]|jgi:AbrB family looped-hinge helix DNA binding protein|nr:AbrB family transcriptional regulator [Candidatus Pacearchaeota archaeon]|tara:strand:+ start:22370 stop:22639 length:270 start_codon:yes stop_codon:yes gene_type:complete
MVTIDIIRMSSKGQIVIPSSMRKDLKEGEDLIIVKDDERFILKKAEKLSEKMKEDLEFARRTEEAWKEIDEGKFTSYSKEEFLKKLEKW